MSQSSLLGSDTMANIKQSRYSWRLIFLCALLVFGIGIIAHAELSSSDLYDKTCPKALSAIRIAVIKAVIKEHRMGASLLRLHFHDCFVNGCDASVLLDDDDASNFVGEKTAGPNENSLRGFEVIDAIKSEMEGLCPGIVSCADILALAARDAVVTLGGPSWTVQLGRRDSATASFKSANSDLPSPALDVEDLITAFSKKGFTAKEMVALSGAHTIGDARCIMYRFRIHNETNIDSEFATSLQSICPSGEINGTTLAPLDTSSPILFDNSYFKNLINKKGLLHSDQQLFNGGSTDSQVTAYSTDPETFREDFAKAMEKMSILSPLTGKDGQIRTDCRKVN